MKFQIFGREIIIKPKKKPTTPAPAPAPALNNDEVEIILGSHSTFNNPPISADCLFHNHQTADKLKIEVGKYSTIKSGLKLEYCPPIPEKPIANFNLGSKPKMNKVEVITKIGNDVKIGKNVTIKVGITIGDGCIINSGAVIYRNLPPYTHHICSGKGGMWGDRSIRQVSRYDSDEIEKLLAISWWNWSDKEIKKNAEYLSTNNISEFIDRFYTYQS